MSMCCFILLRFSSCLLDKEQQANDARAQKKAVVNVAAPIDSTPTASNAPAEVAATPVAGVPVSVTQESNNEQGKQQQVRPKSRSISERFASSFGGFGHNALDAVTAVGTAVGNGVVEAGHGVVDAGKGLVLL